MSFGFKTIAGHTTLVTRWLRSAPRVIPQEASIKRWTLVEDLTILMYLHKCFDNRSY